MEKKTHSEPSLEDCDLSALGPPDIKSSTSSSNVSDINRKVHKNGVLKHRSPDLFATKDKTTIDGIKKSVKMSDDIVRKPLFSMGISGGERSPAIRDSPVFTYDKVNHVSDRKIRGDIMSDKRDGERSPRISPLVQKSSAFTFGTTDECLPNVEESTAKRPAHLQRATSLLSPNSPKLPKAPLSPDTDSICSFGIRPPAFGSRRRMSRSLPELRDIQFVSVLPDLEEEESDATEFEGEPEPCEKPARSPKHRKLDFILCGFCQALGLGNFWRFPYYCYSNGGGPFVLAYVILMVLCGVPILCMELATGQLTQAGPISAFGQLCPLMKGIGLANMMLSFWITAYYSVLVSWTLFYTFNSFYSPPRWTRCSNSWNSDSCREQIPPTPPPPSAEALNLVTEPTSLTSAIFNFFNATETTYMSDNVTSSLAIRSLVNSEIAESSDAPENISTIISLTHPLYKNFTHPAVEFVHLKMLETSKDISDLGELRFDLMAAVLFVWILTYFALRKTDFLKRTTIYVLTIISHVLLFCIFFRTVALEGAKNGLHFLFQFNAGRLIDARVWLYALVQVFHSLGLILGPTIIMGSCHKPHNNLLRDTIALTAITLFTVFLISCITFGAIGHIAVKLNRPVELVLDGDPSMVFVVYSVIIGSMPIASCWGVLFFLVFLCLGLDSQIKLMATLVSALKESYTFCIKQKFQAHSIFLAALCGVCFFATVFYLTQAGIFYLQLIDHYVAVWAVGVLALLEVCTLGWLYGAINLAESIQKVTNKNPSYFYKITWMVVCPLIITVILAYSAIALDDTAIRRNYEYPSWSHVLGWILFTLTLCWVPFLAISAFRRAPKLHVLSRINSTLQPKNRAYSGSEPKPVIILNESMMYNEDYSDYKLAQFPSSANSLQSYATERTALEKRDFETNC